ncbi:MAG: aldo/keto reductase [Muribaculaceae bacterium]|nr:aldo/keto reductase [Muribaculaceae bacterium]
MEEKITLNNGKRLPMIGYGVYQIPASITEICVNEALETGYKLIDTAQCYGNETEVGRAVKNSGMKREDLFITTKIWGTRRYNDTIHSIQKSLDRLDTYIDLLLIHEPTGDYKEIYVALEDSLSTGNVKSIGVANFLDDTFIDLINNCRIIPAVDQIETHVFRQQVPMQKMLEEYGTVLQSWSPLACARGSIFENPVLKEIAGHHNKTIAQIALRWLIQRGIPIIPKSTHKERMEENINILDFELTKGEMEDINKLEKGKSLFNWW